MSQLIQLVYISRANFRSASSAAGVEPTVARILQQSRVNNPRQRIGGVLYYGDGCFFQCLEGERDVVLGLAAKIKADSRHKDFKVVHQAQVSERQFSNWSMKYVPVSDAVKTLLVSHGYKQFDPYQFDDKLIADLLGMFLRMRASGQVSDQPASKKSSVERWLLGVAALAALGLLAFIVLL